MTWNYLCDYLEVWIREGRAKDLTLWPPPTGNCFLGSTAFLTTAFLVAMILLGVELSGRSVVITVDGTVTRSVLMVFSNSKWESCCSLSFCCCNDISCCFCWSNRYCCWAWITWLFCSLYSCCCLILIAASITSVVTFAAIASSSIVCPFKSTWGKFGSWANFDL